MSNSAQDNPQDNEPAGKPDSPADSMPVGTRRRRPADLKLEHATPPTQSRRGYGCADVITAIFLLLTVMSASITVLLIANPHSALNPFPMPTLPRPNILASPLPSDTPTITPTRPPPTPTKPAPSKTPSPTATSTLTPTITNTPVVGGASVSTLTPTVLQPTAKFTLAPFAFTSDPVKYIKYAGPEGCNWQSIAGSVLDMNGKPLKGVALRVKGSSGNIDEFAYSGTQARYGESGFEVFLGTTPREDTYTIQMLGRTGNAISDVITITTKSDCDSNVAVVAFNQNHPF